MRVVKEAEERRNEILDVAEELFSSKGFDNTSTNDILERVGIARGTLYYHFKSKEEILDAMIERINNQLIAAASKIASDTSLGVVERIMQSVMALNVDNELGHEVMEIAHKPQNALMHQKIQQTLLAGIVPIITRLVEEGIEAKMFDTQYPEETVEMILLYANVSFDDLIEQTPEQKLKRVKAFIYNVERLFGMESGALQEAMMPMFL